MKSTTCWGNAPKRTVAYTEKTDSQQSKELISTLLALLSPGKWMGAGYHNELGRVQRGNGVFQK